MPWIFGGHVGHSRPTQTKTNCQAEEHLFWGGVGDLGPKGSWVPLKAAIDGFFDVGPLGPRMLWNSLRAAIDLWGSC